MWRYRVHYAFLLLPVIWYAVFCYYPMYGITVAFKDFKFNRGIMGSEWVGMVYFRNFLTDKYFWIIVKNTLVISLLKLVCGFPAPIIMALFINEIRSRRYKKVVQTLSYLPHFVSWVVVVALLTKLLSPNNGAINELRQSISPGVKPIFFMGERGWFYPLVVLSDIWKNVGWGSIIYLAALTAIDPALYEAAELDGANRWQRMAHITLPGISPTIGVLLILSLSGILNAGFDQIYLMQTASTLQMSEVLDTYVLKRGIQQGNFSYAAAVGIFRSVISMVLIVTVNFISRRTSEISLW